MTDVKGFDILGYFIDEIKEEREVGAGDVFVALFDEDNGYYCYAPIGQHSEIDVDYLEDCEEITVAQFKAISGHLYTPEDYLE